MNRRITNLSEYSIDLKFFGVCQEKTPQQLDAVPLHIMLEIIRIACYNKHMETREKLIILKESTGLNWRKFAAYFDLPYRTMQDWYLGNRRMPEYMLRLMHYKLAMENMLKDWEKEENGE